MKHILKFLFIIFVISLVSCADDKPPKVIIIDEDPKKPNNGDPPATGIDAYDALKKYVNRTTSPMFKIGVGVLLPDYVSKGTIYNLLTENFDQITLGNEMKHDAVVMADGSLRLNNIVNLMQVAKEAGVTVYGHTFVWHSQQRASYLNSLIAPSLVVGNSGEALDPNLITNSNFENGDTGWNNWGNGSTRGITDEGGGFGGGYALWFTNPSVANNSWNAQLAYDFPNPLAVNARYILNLNVKASKHGAVSVGMQNPDNYTGVGTFGLVNFTTEWTEVTLETTITGANAIRFIFDCGTFDGTIYFDNVTVSRVNPNNTNATRFVSLSEKTAAEKDLIITGEMERYIKGLLEVTQDIKEWDVVNEPMDDGRPYELKTGIGRPNINAGDFFWQDYMGKDYAVKAVQFARLYGPHDIKLFINDYNLEYNLNKCRGIIEYVKYVESQGVFVDGLGTQMHISLDTNRDNIVEMYRLLAATGKLIKITELDIGLGGGSNPVTAATATDEHYKRQADLYQFVVEKYLEIIPINQRYGITVWSPFDSPDTQGAWRRNQPIGLWNKDFRRKPAYAGFANGLAGRDVSADK